MKANLTERIEKSNRVSADPFTTLVRAAVRLEFFELREQGLLGNSDATQRIAYSPEEFGRAIGMSGVKVRQLIKRGMPATRFGSQLRIQPAEAFAWAKEHGDYLAEQGADEVLP